MYERPWVEKFKTGEYLSKWKGYDTILIGGPYSQNIGIGEEKFSHCIDYFSGIGDVDWWITAELNKLTKDEESELEWICKYKTYISKEVITHKKVELLSELYGCEPFHIYRIGNTEILNLIEILNSSYKLIEKSSRSCQDPKTLEWKAKVNQFDILSFAEYKEKNKDITTNQ